jgi:hypothetical protein
MTDDHNLVDPDRGTWLQDVGQPDYIATTTLAADGTEHLVLAKLAALNDHTELYDASCTDVSHEQLGPMPAAWRHRVALAPLRCGRPTKTGRPCRAPVRAGMPTAPNTHQAGRHMTAATGRAALLCYHDDGSCEWTYWDDRPQARQAEAELAPCGPDCIYVHSIVGSIDPEPDDQAAHGGPDRASRPPTQGAGQIPTQADPRPSC